jgi:xanthine dehydrogenase YagR molybdenum-binding subunit
MRFVPVKDEHQQATLCLHRTRHGFVEERTATYDGVRGLLAEFGVVLPQKPERLRKEITAHLNTLPGWAARSIRGYILGAAISKGRIKSIDTRQAESSPGVLGVVTYRNAGPLGVGKFYVQRMLASPEIDHYHQPIAVVVAETFEQARAASSLIRVDYTRSAGRFDLTAQLFSAPVAPQMAFGGPTETHVGDFERAFSDAELRVDETYTVPDQAHAMMEPHATIAAWEGDRVTCWTSIQQMNWGTRDLGLILGIPRDNVRLISSFIGGGFGGKGVVVQFRCVGLLRSIF